MMCSGPSASPMNRSASMSLPALLGYANLDPSGNRHPVHDRGRVLDDLEHASYRQLLAFSHVEPIAFQDYPTLGAVGLVRGTDDGSAGPGIGWLRDHKGRS